MKRKRTATGIPELDTLIEGGLRAGKTYLVIGEPGTGKTVFGLQFLVSGLMDKEKGLYVAIDEKRGRFQGKGRIGDETLPHRLLFRVIEKKIRRLRHQRLR